MVVPHKRTKEEQGMDREASTEQAEQHTVVFHFRDGSAATYSVAADEFDKLQNQWRNARTMISLSAHRRTSTAALDSGGEACTVFLRLDDVLYID